MDFLNQEIVYGNTLLQILLAAALILAGTAVLYLTKKAAGKSVLKRRPAESGVFWKTQIDRMLYPVALAILVRGALNFLTLSENVAGAVNILILAALVTSVGFGVSHSLVFLAQRRFALQTGEAENSNFSHWFSVFIKIIVWGVALILFLDNMGVKITSLITVLGVGGIALAFAAQTIIADFFCFFTIFLDRPFTIGDFLQVGAQSGTVEHIGIKTTRLRSLDGEQIVFANTDITKARVQNYKTMEERRVLLHLGVAYETPAAKLERIPGLLREILEKQPDARFGRAHFTGFRDYALEFEVAYYIPTNDYEQFLDVQHQVNLGIVQSFGREGIRFAYPTTDVNLYTNTSVEADIMER